MPKSGSARFALMSNYFGGVSNFAIFTVLHPIDNQYYKNSDVKLFFLLSNLELV